ncbi:cytochrome P450 [Martensiomyces pterosporus]|nr:cytochrome P450 [Martensiomyces pterosporus]
MSLILRTGLKYIGHLDPLLSFVNDVGLQHIMAIAATGFVAYRLIRAYFFSPLRHIPGPILSRLTDLRCELYCATGYMGANARADYERYGDIYVYQPNSIAISNPADVRAVLGSNAVTKAHYYRILDFTGIENTLSARSPELANMRRRQLGPYFNHAYLARMEPVVIKRGILSIKQKWDTLIQASKDGWAEVNYSNDFLFATFGTISTLVFGEQMKELKSNDQSTLDWISSTLMYLGIRSMFSLLPRFPFALLLQPWERQYEQLSSYTNISIAKRRELLSSIGGDGRNAETSKPVDLLQAFLDAEDPESKIRMDPVHIHAESLLMLQAGSETTANTLMWTIHLLTLYPEHYKHAAKEVRSAFGKDHLITYSEARSQLPFVEACIYESLRLAPATGGLLPRVAPKGGIMLSGHFIPEDTVVFVNVAGANLNKGYWEEPHLYNPHRFLDNEEARRNVLTFSSGMRICPGRHLAWMEMLTIVANLLKDYNFELPADCTHLGPGVLDKKGYPRLLDSKFFIITKPTSAARDCRLLISRHE